MSKPIKTRLITAVWLAAAGAMTFLVWRSVTGTIGSARIILPPFAVVPVTALAVIAARIFLPPLKVLTWLSAAALLFLAAWIIIPAVRTLPWEIHGVAVPLALIVPTGLFLLAALLGRPPFAEAESWPVLGWKWVSAKERRVGKRFFDHTAFIAWGFHKVPAEKLRTRFRRLRGLALTVFAVTMSLPLAKALFFRGTSRDLSAVTDFDPTVSTRVYSDDGEEVCRFTLEDRILVPIAGIPARVRQAFIAAEDKNFLLHDGVDPAAIVHAAIDNYRTGSMRGASTVTQQVVKQVVLKTSERSMSRKIREAFLAVELERRASKDKILEVYMNHLFLGRAYGIQAAATAFFGKNVSDLTVAEAAVLAGMPKAPSAYSPTRNFKRARGRQLYVLGRMRELGFIDDHAYEQARDERIIVVEHRASINRTAAPYFCEFLRKKLEEHYGKPALYERGLEVRTTLDMKMQRAAEAAVHAGLIDLERRLGWPGPENSAKPPASCDDLKWSVADDAIAIGRVLSAGPGGITVCVDGASFQMHPHDVAGIREWESVSKKTLAPGDAFSVRVRTFAKPEGRLAISAIRTGGDAHPEMLQAAIVVVDPKTGALKAHVGGYDFNERQYDNGVQAHRQPGSSIKPYVYLAALRGGVTIADRMVDRPVRYPSASGWWSPENFKGKNTRQRYLGVVDLKTALAKSLNSISVQLGARVGVSEVIKTIRDLGITTPLDRVLPITIGGLSKGFTVWEHAYGMATIAANGRMMPRQCHGDGACDESLGFYLREVRERGGSALYAYAPEPPLQAVPPADAYVLTTLMKGVVESGTGWRVQELGRPAAGKTGTTNSFKDAWYMGYTADLVAGVWVGRADASPIAGEEKEPTGGAVALPIWLAFMKAAHPPTPPRDFPVPEDVVLMTDAQGRILPFRRGTVPHALLSP